VSDGSQRRRGGYRAENFRLCVTKWAGVSNLILLERLRCNIPTVRLTRIAHRAYLALSTLCIAYQPRACIAQPIRGIAPSTLVGD
jgi:hypothetical protein